MSSDHRVGGLDSPNSKFQMPNVAPGLAPDSHSFLLILAICIQ